MATTKTIKYEEFNFQNKNKSKENPLVVDVAAAAIAVAWPFENKKMQQSTRLLLLFYLK